MRVHRLVNRFDELIDRMAGKVRLLLLGAGRISGSPNRHFSSTSMAKPSVPGTSLR